MLTIWFMYDNHTFAKVQVGDRVSLIDQAMRLFAEDGCGMLAVKDEMDGTLKDLYLHGKQISRGHWGIHYWQAEEWADKVLVELAFHKMMAA